MSEIMTAIYFEYYILQGKCRRRKFEKIKRKFIGRKQIGINEEHPPPPPPKPKKNTKEILHRNIYFFK